MTGADLKHARIVQKLSRRALAEMCGIHPDTVRYWEGKPFINARGYAPRRMLAALGVTPPKTIATPRHRGGTIGYFPALTRARGGVLSLTKPMPKAASARVTCDARTRKGTLCRALSEPGKRRCRFHGGLSTGPKTPEGRARIAAAQRLRWKKNCEMIDPLGQIASQI